MYKILLVDDEILVRDAIRENIDWKSLDCELVGDCENGRQAVEFVQSHKVDVVLTDICMPYMDGMELSEFLHDNYPDILIVIFSGFGEFEYAKKAIRYNVSEYMLKPVTAMELTKVLRNMKEKLDSRKKEQKKDRFLQHWKEKYQGTPVEKVLSELLDVIKAGHIKNLNEWEQSLMLGAEIYNCFPFRKNETKYLAVFATEITGNPHAFDQKGSWGTFLYQVIPMELRQRRVFPQKSEIFPAFFRQRCFLAEGILIDDISNYVMLSHVKAQKKDGDLHTGMEGFWQEDDMVQVPLAVLSKWNSIFCKDNEMYIVENPSVFAGLCAGHTKQVSCMCMNGQPRLAGLVTLDLLAASGTVVYYAGDLDPEGLLIAQKISEYYAGEFHYWHMTVEDYEKSKSNETISEKRIKSLERITDTELFPVAEKMRLDRLTGYQEKIEIK